MAQKKESAKSTREKAAEARAAAQAAERRRERTIRIVGWACRRGGRRRDPGHRHHPVAQQRHRRRPVPIRRSRPGSPPRTATGSRSTPPRMRRPSQIYEDFQCPACANLENQFGPVDPARGRRRQHPVDLPPDDLPGQQPSDRSLIARRERVRLRDHRRGRRAVPQPGLRQPAGQRGRRLDRRAAQAVRMSTLG